MSRSVIIVITAVILLAGGAAFIVLHEDETEPESQPVEQPKESDRHSPSATIGIVDPSFQKARIRVVYGNGQGTTEGDLQGLAGGLLDIREDDTTRNEEANRLRKRGYSGLTDDLVKVLNNPSEKERFRSWAVQHLYLNWPRAGPEERETILDVLHLAVGDPHLKVQREALLALHSLKEPRARELALEWLHDESRRDTWDLCLRVVREQDIRAEIDTVRRLAEDSHEANRIAAIVTLAEWRDEASRPMFEAAAKSNVVRIQRAGKAALRRLDQTTAKSIP